MSMKLDPVLTDAYHPKNYKHRSKLEIPKNNKTNFTF